LKGAESSFPTEFLAIAFFVVCDHAVPGFA